MEWVSVKERLPEQDTSVLVREKHIRGGGYHYTVYYYDPTMYQPYWDYVTHWMPLPEPPCDICRTEDINKEP